MHEHRACHDDHHGGVIINPDTAVCRHCQLTLPVDRSDPLAMVDTMLAHMARIHPNDFESYAKKAASMFGYSQLNGLTAEGFLTYQRDQKDLRDPDKEFDWKGMGFYL